MAKDSQERSPTHKSINLNIKVVFHLLVQFLDVNFVRDTIVSPCQKVGHTSASGLLQLATLGLSRLVSGSPTQL